MGLVERKPCLIMYIGREGEVRVLMNTLNSSYYVTITIHFKSIYRMRDIVTHDINLDQEITKFSQNSAGNYPPLPPRPLYY